MIQYNPTDEMIRDATGVMLMDSPRNFFETVGWYGSGNRKCLTIVVDSEDAPLLKNWRTRVAGLRPDNQSAG